MSAGREWEGLSNNSERACLGNDAGGADDGVQRVGLGAHGEVDAREALLQPLPVPVSVTHCVHKYLQGKRISSCSFKHVIREACQAGVDVLSTLAGLPAPGEFGWGAVPLA